MQQFNQSQAQNLAGQQLNAQQQQFGAGLGLQGMQTALSGSKALADIGQTQYGQNMGLLSMQNQFGGQQQQQMHCRAEWN
jgi:xanthine/uracil permease